GAFLTQKSMKIIYKICPRELWREAQTLGRFHGAPVDVQDGYLHFSTSAQVVETAARHFAGQKDLVLVAVDGERLEDGLVYEASRGGDLFPHLYGILPLSAVIWTRDLPLGPDGTHLFPDLE